MKKRLPLYVLSMFPLSVFAQEVPSSLPTSEPASVATSAPAPDVCGDGLLAASEACDDGNILDGDGCSSLCQRSDAKPKSAAAAFGLSLGASAASFGLMIAGSAIPNENVGAAVSLLGVGAFIVAPSAGHFYAGEKRHGLLFSGIRLATGTITTVGFVFALSSIFEEGTALSKAGGAMFVLGGLGSIGLLVYDLIDAPRSVKRMTASLSLPEKKVSASLLPTLISRPNQTLTPGLSLGLRF